jgi:hypothetical protein
MRLKPAVPFPNNQSFCVFLSHQRTPFGEPSMAHWLRWFRGDVVALFESVGQLVFHNASKSAPWSASLYADPRFAVAPDIILSQVKAIRSAAAPMNTFGVYCDRDDLNVSKRGLPNNAGAMRPRCT